MIYYCTSVRTITVVYMKWQGGCLRRKNTFVIFIWKSLVGKLYLNLVKYVNESVILCEKQNVKVLSFQINKCSMMMHHIQFQHVTLGLTPNLTQYNDQVYHFTETITADRFEMTWGTINNDISSFLGLFKSLKHFQSQNRNIKISVCWTRWYSIQTELVHTVYHKTKPMHGKACKCSISADVNVPSVLFWSVV